MVMDVASALIERGEEMIAKTEELKKWCLEHYNKGADTMVECWDDSNYHDLLAEVDMDMPKAYELLERICSVYRERQADAAFYSRGERD